MSEKIGVQAVSDLITSKAGREYFTFEDMGQKRYVCFIPQLKEYCNAGSEIEADITAGKSPEDSPRLDMIYVKGKPVIQPPAKSTGRSYGKSKEELLQIRQLAEAQNRSIQAQTALNRAVDLTVAFINNKVAPDPDAIGINTRRFYQLLQELALISEAKVIHQKIKEVADVKTTEKLPDEKTTPRPTRVDDSGRDELIGKLKETAKAIGWTGKQTRDEVAGLFELDLSKVTSVSHALEQLTLEQLKLLEARLDTCIPY